VKRTSETFKVRDLAKRILDLNAHETAELVKLLRDWPGLSGVREPVPAGPDPSLEAGEAKSPPDLSDSLE